MRNELKHRVSTGAAAEKFLPGEKSALLGFSPVLNGRPDKGLIVLDLTPRDPVEMALLGWGEESVRDSGDFAPDPNRIVRRLTNMEVRHGLPRNRPGP